MFLYGQGDGKYLLRFCERSSAGEKDQLCNSRHIPSLMLLVEPSEEGTSALKIGRYSFPRFRGTGSCQIPILQILADLTLMVVWGFFECNVRACVLLRLFGVVLWALERNSHPQSGFPFPVGVRSTLSYFLNFFP